MCGITVFVYKYKVDLQYRQIKPCFIGVYGILEEDTRWNPSHMCCSVGFTWAKFRAECWDLGKKLRRRDRVENGLCGRSVKKKCFEMMCTVLRLHMVSKMQVSWHTFAWCLKNDGCQQRGRDRRGILTPSAIYTQVSAKYLSGLIIFIWRFFLSCCLFLDFEMGIFGQFGGYLLLAAINYNQTK